MSVDPPIAERPDSQRPDSQQSGSQRPGLKPKGYIPTLDGLRGIAVLLVMWEHIPLGLGGRLEGLARLWVQPGYLGVDIFFVLSGFLITRILLVDKDKGVPLRYFLMRRFLRIFPIYYLTLLVVWIVRGGPELIWCATYLSNFWFPFHNVVTPLGHTWSLAVEEHYYLLWPLVVYLLTRRRSLAFAGLFLIPGAIAAAFFANSYYAPDHDLGQVAFAREVIQTGTMYRMLSLSLGSVLAYVEPFLRRSGWRTLLIALVFAAGGYRLAWISGNRPLLGDPVLAWLPAFWLVSFAAISTACVLTALALDRIGHGAELALTNPVLRFVGRISYGLYLYHFPIYFALGVGRWRDGEPPPPLLVLSAVGLTFLVATLSYYALERPILRLQQRFRAKP